MAQRLLMKLGFWLVGLRQPHNPPLQQPLRIPVKSAGINYGDDEGNDVVFVWIDCMYVRIDYGYSDQM